jgi:hypothetical protein
VTEPQLYPRHKKNGIFVLKNHEADDFCNPLGSAARVDAVLRLVQMLEVKPAINEVYRKIWTDVLT